MSSFCEQILQEKISICRGMYGDDVHTEILSPGEQAIATVLGKELAAIKSRLHDIVTVGEIG